MHALRDIFRRFIGRVERVTFEFVNAYEGVTPQSYESLAKADIVIQQQGQRSPLVDRRHIAAGVPVHAVPAVNGIFLWPLQGVPHPLEPRERYGNPPYPDDYNDQFLARLIRQDTPPAEALAVYRNFDVAAERHAQRLYVHTLRTQKSLDEALGYRCAEIIETYLQAEPIFQAPYHFGGRIARHLAATLIRRLDFPEIYAKRVETHLAEAPFLPRFLPVHPSIARHFGLRWATDQTRYPFLYEGGYTFDEYVLRFMRATWSASLQEGVIDTFRGEAGAKPKLMTGLQEAPRSGLGHHALSTLLEQEDDHEGALHHQRLAFALAPEYGIALRLAELLKRGGDIAGAAAMYQEAARLDPVDPAVWSDLRDVLLSQGRSQEAAAADRRFREFSSRLM